VQAETITIEVKDPVQSVMGVTETCIEERWAGCGMCADLCPYSAPAPIEIIQNREHQAE